MSSGLNALAAVVLIDMVKPVYLMKKGHEMNEELSIRVSKSLGE